MMILKRPLAEGAPRGQPSRSGWKTPSTTLFLKAMVAALVVGGSFLAGAQAHRVDLFRRLRHWIPLRAHLNYWHSLVAAPPLPTLTIDMKFKHLETVRKKRDEALRLGLLFASDEDLVPAQVRFEDRTIGVKARLKGDWTDHLSTEKWSFRIQVKGDDQLMGMRRFSIQHPMTRKYLDEWAFLENLRTEGILAPRYSFVNVIFNGDGKGIYALEEFFAKEMIESQSRREGLFVVSDEELRWARRGQGMKVDRAQESLADMPGYHELLIRAYGSGKIDRSPALGRQRDQAIRLLRGFEEGTLPASQVFDVDLLGRYLAIAELWWVTHGLLSINSVFFYNPVTSRLEPVGYDAMPLAVPDSLDPGQLFTLEEEWTRATLRDPGVARAFVKELLRVSSDGYLEDLRTGFGKQLEGNLAALHREWPELEEPWEKLGKRQKLLRAILDPPQIVQAVQISESRNSAVVQVANMMSLPTEILGFKAETEIVSAADALTSPARKGGRNARGQGVILPPKSPGRPMEFVDFTVPLRRAKLHPGSSEATPLVVLSRLVGEERSRETAVTAYVVAAGEPAIPSAPPLKGALARHRFLRTTADNSMLAAAPGTWDVDGDLVLPAGIGLELKAGTTLRFSRDAVLLSRGPLVFRGTPQAPVTLSPRGESWAGIVVLEAGRPSLWEDVVVRKTHGVERGGWILTGAITFYQSPIVLVGSRISGSTAEDALNIIRSDFEFHDCEFGDTSSDAFDGDFVRGVIKGTIYHDIAGDAIDVSGSSVDLREVRVVRTGDKGISAGEGSEVRVTQFHGKDVGIGVASKDRSNVNISDSVISGFKHAGLAVYTKKPEFGPASTIADNVTLDGGAHPILVQEGSWLRRDGRVISGGPLDVKALYAAGILGN